MTVFTPKKGTKNRTAVTIFPNGGYRVVVDKGDDIVKAFTDKGITTFVLKYHLPTISFAHAKVEATITKLLRSNPSENALSLR